MNILKQDFRRDSNAQKLALIKKNILHDILEFNKQFAKDRQ